MSQKFMVVTMRRLSFTQRRRYTFITLIDDEMEWTEQWSQN